MKPGPYTAKQILTEVKACLSDADHVHRTIEHRVERAWFWLKKEVHSEQTLSLDVNEARVVHKALDTLIRVHLGQPVHAMSPIIGAGVRSDGRPLEIEEAQRARALLDQVQEIMTGILNGGPAIGNPIVSNDARIASRLIGVLEDNPTVQRLYARDGTPRD